MEFNHKPVLLEETIEGLHIKSNGIYIDGTMGGAGHSEQIVKKLSQAGRLIGIDRDTDALQAAKAKLAHYTNVKYVHDNHNHIKEILQELEIEKVDGILLDLGVSSYQIDTEARGFSYMHNADLDMRMDRTQTLTAKEIINTYSEEELIKILYEYGEEKCAKQIVKKIIEQRKKSQIQTTQELVEIIKQAVPFYDKTAGHPAKRTFQAIRIETNNELKPLYDTVKNAIDCLNSGGRLCIITFHSLEDKAVKKAYINAEGKCTCPKDLPYCVCGNKPIGRIVNKKPIEASLEEQSKNSRSKSAKLRIFEKI